MVGWVVHTKNVPAVVAMTKPYSRGIVIVVDMTRNANLLLSLRVVCQWQDRS